MKPKILVFTKLFWPEGGGAELATYLIVRDILSRYFDVTIVSGTREPVVDVLKHAKYIHWDVLEAKFKPIEWLKVFASSNYIKKLVEHVDVIYIPSHTLVPVSIIAKKVKPEVKVVLHLHNYQLLTYTSVVLTGRGPDVTTDIMVERGEHSSVLRAILAGLGHYLNYLNRYSLNYVDEVMCVSKRQCEIILKYIPGLKGKTTVVYNPPPSLPHIEKRLGEEPVLIYAGGGSYVKGLHIVAKALARVLKRYRCKIYVIYGRKAKTSQKPLLERLSQRLDNKLRILNKLPHREYLRLHESSWGLLFPSLCEEPLPYAVVEASLLRTIPIASRAGGIVEILEKSPAERYLFTPGDIDEFINKLELLLSQSRSHIEDIGLKLKEHVSRVFNPEDIERKIVDVFW